MGLEMGVQPATTVRPVRRGTTVRNPANAFLVESALLATTAHLARILPIPLHFCVPWGFIVRLVPPFICSPLLDFSKMKPASQSLNHALQDFIARAPNLAEDHLECHFNNFLTLAIILCCGTALVAITALKAQAFCNSSHALLEQSA